MFTLNLNSLCDHFTISNLRKIKFNGYAKSCLKFSFNYGDVHITHTVKNELMCFGVVFKSDCLIFFTKLCHTKRNLIFITLRKRRNRLSHERFGICCSCIVNITVPSKCITCICVSKLSCHTDITTAKDINFCLSLTLNYIDVGHLFVCISCSILKEHILSKSTIHNLEEGHLTNEWVRYCLKYEESCFTFGFDFLFVTIFKKFNLLSCVSGEGFIDYVKECPNAPKLCSRTTKNRNDITMDNAFVNCIKSFHRSDIFTLKVLHHKVFVSCSNSFHKHVAVFFHSFNAFSRNGLN